MAKLIYNQACDSLLTLLLNMSQKIWKLKVYFLWILKLKCPSIVERPKYRWKKILFVT